MLPPGSTIGIVGGGQLGRMLALVARRMGYRTVVLDPDEDAPAGGVADQHIVAPLSDLEAAGRLAETSDVVTLEWENADVPALRALAEHVPVRPGWRVLEVAQNRLREKETARRLGLSTAGFRAVTNVAELRDGLRELGLPAVLKTATGGYDGRGQRVIRDVSEAPHALAELGSGRVELILEEWVDFALEASVICGRGVDGSTASYPIGRNIHRNGILDFTIVPAQIPEEVAREAVRVGEALANGLEVVGLLAVELFIDAEGRILVNEIAPRPHNSGHYTWEACSVSQFEQQLRAVCGLPLARPVLLRPAAMANLLGEHLGDTPSYRGIGELLATPMLSLHLYGKKQSRPGRKMGHITALADDPQTAFEHVDRAREALGG